MYICIYFFLSFFLLLFLLNSGVFLPGFVKPQDCRSKEGVLNKPLCIAWSSSGRNHYIPLVGVKGRSLISGIKCQNFLLYLVVKNAVVKREVCHCNFALVHMH